MPEKEQPIKIDEGKPTHPASEYWKAFLLSAGAGAAFGLVAAVVYLQLDTPPWHPALFVPGLALLAGLFSGLAGLGGAHLDQLALRWGIQKPVHRIGISFAIIAVIIFSIAFAGMRFSGVVPQGLGQQYALWMMLAGLAFGAAFALFTYRAERTRQKMLLLEMENRHLAELASREELLREAARNLAVTAERTRMARELHDSISQGMHGIVYALRSLRASLAGQAKALETVRHLEETAAETLKELRRLITELSPSPLEDHGLAEALRLHCDLFARRQQIAVEFTGSYSGGLLPEQEAALYRIAQETLANVQQHTSATAVTVSLHGEGDAITLTVRDNGRGFDPASAARGHGLANMEARARQNGGRLDIRSSPGAGSAVMAAFPKPLHPQPAGGEGAPA